MNFLQLCQMACQEMGIAGTGPTATTGQTGELKRVVDWVARAYREICGKHANWKFLRSSFSVNTIIGQEAYLPTACTDSVLAQLIGHATVGKFGKWMPDTFRIYKLSEGAGTRQYIWPVDYEWFRDRYQLIVPSNNRPFQWSVRPRDYALLMGPKPNDVYVVEGDYYRVAPVLAADADEPIFQEQYHMSIVWRAVRYYALYEEDGGLYAGANQEYKSEYGLLMTDQLPAMELGAPLA